MLTICLPYVVSLCRLTGQSEVLVPVSMTVFQRGCYRALLEKNLSVFQAGKQARTPLPPLSRIDNYRNKAW